MRDRFEPPLPVFPDLAGMAVLAPRGLERLCVFVSKLNCTTGLVCRELLRHFWACPTGAASKRRRVAQALQRELGAWPAAAGRSDPCKALREPAEYAVAVDAALQRAE